jgi:hypothetical protein
MPALTALRTAETVTDAVSRSGLAAREIKELLRQQRSRELEVVFARSLMGAWLCGPFECVRLIVETSMTLRQGRLASRWLAKLPPFCTPENVPVALAHSAEQFPLIEVLFEDFQASERVVEFEQFLLGEVLDGQDFGDAEADPFGFVVAVRFG